MRNVNLPLPVALAAGALLLLGGYIVGVALGGEEPTESTAQVQSYDRGSSELCLTGEGVEELDGTKDGVLCGIWRHEGRAARPEEGEDFRFVAVTNEGDNDEETATYIYGNVLP